jgi:hypothetical protein
MLESGCAEPLLASALDILENRLRTHKILHVFSHTVVCPELRSAQFGKSFFPRYIFARWNWFGHCREVAAARGNALKSSEIRISSGATRDS